MRLNRNGKAKWPLCFSLLLLSHAWGSDPWALIAEGENPLQKHEIPSAQVEIEKGWGVILSGDLLYWKAQEEGLSYALPTLNNTSNPPNAQSDLFKGVNGKVARVKPEYAFGFKVGAIFDLPWDEWDLHFFWTSYQNHHHNHSAPNSPKTISPFWLNNNFSPIAQKASAHWELQFNSTDLTLGRAIYSGKFLALFPFAGFKAGWIEEHLNVKYDEITFSNSQTLSWIKSRNQNSFQGYGITAGLNTLWDLGWGISIKGNGSFALLWGDFDIKQREKTSTHSTRTRLKDSIQKITTVFDLFAGLQWESVFNDRYYVQLQAGWEEQIWTSQNQLNRFISNTENLGATMNVQGDLTFSGWTVGAQFGF